MNVLLYCAAVVTLAKSSAVQHFAETTAQAPTRSSIPRKIEEGPWGSNNLRDEDEDDDRRLYGPTEPHERHDAPSRKEGNDIEMPGATGGHNHRPTRSHGANVVKMAPVLSSSSSFTGAKAMSRSVNNPSPPPLPPPPAHGKVYHRPPPIRIIRRIPTTPLPQPYFDPSSPTNISAQLGMHAFLPCTIRNLNNNSISWIRSRDSHILAVDRYTFIADERFQAWHEEDTETWTLQVKYVQERDAGRYECQISTEPKMSHFVHFHVVTPLVHIPGGPDIYVKSGSTVTLKCVISGALILPEYIFWYQGKERVLAEDLAGGRQVFVERISDDTTIGTLIITTASPRDQGSYTCVPASLPTASVTLHVLNAGEHPAAMHHGGGPLGRCPPPFSLLLFCLLVGWFSREALLTFSSSAPSITTCLLNFLPR